MKHLVVPSRNRRLGQALALTTFAMATFAPEALADEGPAVPPTLKAQPSQAPVAAPSAAAAPSAPEAVPVAPAAGAEANPPSPQGALHGEGLPELSFEDDPEDDPLSEAEPLLDEIEFVGVATPFRRAPGAAHELTAKQLDRFRYDDVHQVVAAVPGVYVRGEDGFGLRPNIGMRGVNPDRSKKIVLMEDGVLFGPAPYSAPAAYYFPLIGRMAGVEVVKGPGAIPYGPNNIGGALNLKTATVPERFALRGDLAVGNQTYRKGHLRVGTTVGRIGYLAELMHIESGGFKRLDGGGDTGFSRQEGMLKFRYQGPRGGYASQTLEAKIGLSLERSNETYLGLTDEDFRATPYRRYQASELDQMKWYRSQFVLSHDVTVGDSFDLRTTVYRQDFTRAWNKFNGLTGANVSNVLADPFSLRNRPYYDVLTGSGDTQGGALRDTLDIGTNHRVFYSEGIQTIAHWEASTESTAHYVQGGVRLHRDAIERVHTQRTYEMRDGSLAEPRAEELLVHNQGRSTALALHVADEIEWGSWSFTPGVRAELVWTRYDDFELPDETRDDYQWEWLPGLGVFYSLTDRVGLLGGVYRGFSPVAPQASSAPAAAELSTNYEGGARLELGEYHAEVIGFFNDYSNLTTTCSQGSGCQVAELDRQFSAGEVWVYGVEALVESRKKLGGGWGIPARLAYTFTQSEFRTSFESEDPTFGTVEAGYSLPYVPSQQVNLSVGCEKEGHFGVDGNLAYMSDVLETAGLLDAAGAIRTDPQWLVGLAGRYEVAAGAELYGRVSNLFGAAPILSRRPFGARPPAARSLQVGLRYDY